MKYKQMKIHWNFEQIYFWPLLKSLDANSDWFLRWTEEGFGGNVSSQIFQTVNRAKGQQHSMQSNNAQSTKKKEICRKFRPAFRLPIKHSGHFDLMIQQRYVTSVWQPPHCNCAICIAHVLGKTQVTKTTTKLKPQIHMGNSPGIQKQKKILLTNCHIFWMRKSFYVRQTTTFVEPW